MSRTLHVVGIKPPDEKWKKMKAVYDACLAADVDIPEEVNDFFEDEKPDDKGVLVLLSGHFGCAQGDGIYEYHDDYKEGYEVNLEEIPGDIKVLRFYCSN